MELLSDKQMLDDIEKAKRGGYSGLLGRRYHKCNNKYLPDFNKNKDSSYILHLDANNLYGWAMMQPLHILILNGKYQRDVYVKTKENVHVIKCHYIKK